MIASRARSPLSPRGPLAGMARDRKRARDGRNPAGAGLDGWTGARRPPRHDHHHDHHRRHLRVHGRGRRRPHCRRADRRRRLDAGAPRPARARDPAPRAARRGRGVLRARGAHHRLPRRRALRGRGRRCRLVAARRPPRVPRRLRARADHRALGAWPPRALLPPRRGAGRRVRPGRGDAAGAGLRPPRGRRGGGRLRAPRTAAVRSMTSMISATACVASIAAPADAASMPTATPTDIAAFAGRVLTPDDAGYDTARAVFNGAIDRRPALIAQATDVDLAARTVHAGAGLTWKELDAATQAHGLAVTGGRVSHTGVAGLTLGSGSGWLERRHGLTADSLLGATVVTAEGDRVHATLHDHTDLLWGLKGGGGNFGVVTEFEFALHEVGPTVLGGPLVFEAARAAEVLAAYRDVLAGADDDLGGAAVLQLAPPAR